VTNVVAATPERAILFVDGNNWFHGMKEAGVVDSAQLAYSKIAQKLVGAARTWIGTRYYIGRVTSAWSPTLVADQRRFLARYEAEDAARHSTHYGRLEPRPVRSEAAHELLAYLASLKTKIDPQVFKDLHAIGSRHKSAVTQVEKAVDVMLAVDLVVMAQRNEYETAYVLSADGDYTHAAQFVRSIGKKVFAASASPGGELAKAVNTFIRLNKGWFADCYR